MRLLTNALTEGRQIDALFSADPPVGAASDLSRADYLNRIVAGRFPYALGLLGRSRSRWFDAYVALPLSTLWSPPQ